VAVTLTEACRVIPTLSDVARPEWDAINPDASLFMGHAWLSSIEPNAVRARYGVVRRDDGRLIGGYPVYLSTGNEGFFHDPYRLVSSVYGKAPIPREAWFPCALAGSRAGFINEPLVAPDLGPSGRRAVLTALDSAVDSVARDYEARTVAHLYLSDAAAAALRTIRPACPPVLVTASAVLAIRWATFDGYLRWLTKGRRETVRRDEARFAEAGYRISTGRLSEWYERLAPLFGNLHRRHGHDVTDEQMVRALAGKVAAMDDISVVFLCHLGDRLAGFSLVFHFGTTLYVWACGFDYTLAQRRGEYATLVFYEPMRYGMTHGATAMHLGIEASTPKILRGAQLEPMWAMVDPGDLELAGWGNVVARWNARTAREWVDRWDSVAIGGMSPAWHSLAGGTADGTPVPAD
jgi:predicted N-acyltransferase